jgi:hypothetical protein
VKLGNPGLRVPQKGSSIVIALLSIAMAHNNGLPTVPSEMKLTPRRLFWNCVLMSLCFAAVEGVVVAILALSAALIDHGLFSTSCGLLYSAFAAGNIISPTVTRALGLKRSLVTGMIGFTVYALAFVYPRPYTIIPGAGISGIFGSLVWTAQGAYFAENARLYAIAMDGRITEDQALATLAGLFAAIFPFVLTACKVTSSLVFMFYGEKDASVLLYSIYAGIAALATVGMCFILPLEDQKAKAAAGTVPDLLLCATLNMLGTDPLMMLLVSVYSV